MNPLCRRRQVPLQLSPSPHPDCAHDKRVGDGLGLDPRVGETKARLRRWRDCLDGAVAMYAKHASELSSDTKGRLALVMPELDDWVSAR